ncbi:hypothetical protein [Brachybacterium sp. GU-2]|uniref:hypothetical protein n=1 Tax=Brachybacterium sp. GU-2 TaxID=3069708 RepID=UPI00280ACECD|nr:hypothetical protein [Brachybacterium sp. GU-2]WME22614.1 hypothetical protein RBL05_13925 [Brachybacterium sp. GU-2]
MNGDGSAPFWERIDVSSWLVLDSEQTGSHETTWLLDERDGTTRWLHKNTTMHEDREQGEDWAEIIATQVGMRLGVPVALTLLCSRAGHRGSVSRDVRPRQLDLFSGHLVLEDCPDVDDYIAHLEGDPAHDPQRPNVKRPGHSIANIRRALDGSGAPPGFEGPETMDAFDVFAGYLLFDALVANRDRHEQNWAQLRPQLTTMAPCLCPSYDHSSSLGFAETEAKMALRAGDRQALRAWARRGTAGRFEHTEKADSLVTLAVEGLALTSSVAQAHWRRRIDEIDLTAVTAPLLRGEIPEMSVSTTRFVIELLTLNLERIRHELGPRR